MEVQGFYDAFKSHFSERLSNPLFPAFCISWLVINYEVPVYLLSGLDAAGKIREINAYLAGGLWGGWWTSIVLPLCLAVIYIAVFPLVSRVVIYHLQKRNKVTQELIIGVVEETPMPVAKIVEMKQAHAERERKLEEDVDRAKQKLDAASALLQAETEKLAGVQSHCATIERDMRLLQAEEERWQESRNELVENNEFLKNALNGADERISELEGRVEEQVSITNHFRKDLQAVDEFVIKFFEGDKTSKSIFTEPSIRLSDEDYALFKDLFENARLRRLTRPR